jgi:putative oxidoreductase
VMSGFAKLTNFQHMVPMLAAKGLPSASLLLFVAAAVEIIGGLSVLIGYYTRLGALLLALYLIPVTLLFHDFWAHSGMEVQMQMVNFLKNVAIFGGLLYVYAFGPGHVSVDMRRGREEHVPRFIERHA